MCTSTFDKLLRGSRPSKSHGLIKQMVDCINRSKLVKKKRDGEENDEDWEIGVDKALDEMRRCYMAELWFDDFPGLMKLYFGPDVDEKFPKRYKLTVARFRGNVHR